MKQRNNLKKQNNKRKILKKDDLNNLDTFIQKCLDTFKFVDPKKELYEATGKDKDIIISHKSTIPDLVIWNKTFNKNNCFIGANTLNQNEFPRFLFYIKIKKNKKAKNNINTKNNKKDFNFEFIEDKDLKHNININIDKNMNINNINTKEKKEKINNNNIITQNDKINNNFSINNKNNKKSEITNKFSIPQNININNNILNNDNMNLAIYLIQLYLDKNGWIILTKDEHFSGPGTSLDLYQYLQEKIKEKANLNEFTIIDINKQVKYFADYFYMILSNILSTIIQKRQIEFMKYKEMNMNALNQPQNIDINNHKNNNVQMNILNYPNISFLSNINNNIYNNNLNNNNQQFYGINFMEKNNINSIQLNKINEINNINNPNNYINDFNLNVKNNNNIKLENNNYYNPNNSENKLIFSFK